MSRLKFWDLFLIPVYLKIRGRIVGRFSKLTMAIYIGFGLFTIASMTLLVILANWQGDFGVTVRPEPNLERRKIAIPQDPVSIDSSPAVAIETTGESKKNQQEKPPESKSVPIIQKGAIQLDFGWQNHPVYKDWRYHSGVDIRGSRGSSVYTIYSGKVTEIFRDRHNGLTVAVKDNLYTVYYGSLSEVSTVVGSVVDSNQLLGKIGNCDEEPYEHLHLAIKKGDQYMDPKLIVTNEWTKN